MAEQAITAEGLTYRYGKLVAVDHISFSVAEGEIMGFLGPNGAGKSTTVKMLTGQLVPGEGKATLFGLDITKNLEKVQGEIGVAFEVTNFYEAMSAEEIDQFIPDGPSGQVGYGHDYDKIEAEIKSRIQLRGTTVDLLPAGAKTPEGCMRINDAVEVQHKADAECYQNSFEREVKSLRVRMPRRLAAGGPCFGYPKRGFALLKVNCLIEISNNKSQIIYPVK